MFGMNERLPAENWQACLLKHSRVVMTVVHLQLLYDFIHLHVLEDFKESQSTDVLIVSHCVLDL